MKSSDTEILAVRFANQGKVIENVRANVESGRYSFLGGKHLFTAWKNRTATAANNGARSELLAEADRLMTETRTSRVTEAASKKTAKKWKFW